MGNGPGGLDDYQALYEKYPRCQGGFVWEWIDHGLRARDAHGREYFAYGGDFGEPVHDGNFVADGLVFPDRTPSPGLLDLKKTVEPIRMRREGDRLRIDNRYDHIGLSHVDFRWTLEVDGEAVDSGPLDVADVPPGHHVVVDLPTVEPGDGERFLTVQAVLAKDLPWAREGHEIGWVQLALRGPLRVHRAGRSVTAEFGADGRLVAVGPYPVTGPALSVWRAPTDNDRAAHGEAIEPVWRALGLHRMSHRVDAVERTATGVAVRTRVRPARPDGRGRRRG
jgi:beta-galactosidase